MKYCFEYSKSFKYIDEIDEIFIYYSGNADPLEEFLQTYQEKTVIMRIDELKVLLDFVRTEDFLICENKNVKIELQFFNNEGFFACLEKFKEHNIGYFFTTHANTWDKLHGLLEMGVTDVFVTEELGFSLDKVRKAVDAYGAQIRVFPNLAQSSFEQTPPLKKFFIRPEDTPIYDQYIDVFDFTYWRTKELPNKEIQNVNYEIYVKKQKWAGDLSDFIVWLDEPIDSRFIVDIFGERRAKCDKRCFKGTPCHLCEAITDFSVTLGEKGIYA